MALWEKPFPDDITPAWKIMTERRGLFTPDMAPISAAEFAWPGAFEYATRFELSDIGHIVLFAGSVPVGSIGIGLRGGRRFDERRATSMCMLPAPYNFGEEFHIHLGKVSPARTILMSIRRGLSEYFCVGHG
jgi:hypothetical protein